MSKLHKEGEAGSEHAYPPFKGDKLALRKSSDSGRKTVIRKSRVLWGMIMAQPNC